MFPFSLSLLDAPPFRTVYEDDPPEPEPEPKPEPKPDPPPKKLKVELTSEQQAFVNSLVAEEKRKAKAATDRAITQLETVKNQIGTTAAEKTALEERIEEIKNTQMTQEQLRQKEEKKRETQHQKDLTEARADAEKWKNLFTSTTIDREIIEAASKKEHKAPNPRHVVNELRPKTRLVEELDGDGKPTGALVPKVKLTATGKEGKPVTMEMTVTEAVKWMSEQEEHANIFDSGATGGLGGNTNNAGRRGAGRNSDDPPEDTNEYLAWRAAEKKKRRGG